MTTTVLVRSTATCLLVALAACSSGPGEPTDPSQTVTPTGASFSCLTSQVLSLAVGEVRAGVTGNICLTNTGSADYVVNGFFGSTSAAANTNAQLTGFGITAASSVVRNVSAQRSSVVDLDGVSPRQSLELSFRAFERNVLGPRLPALRAAMRNRATRAITPRPVNVGDAVTVNASATGCANPVNKSAHVVAVTSRTIILADDANPAGGFTNAEYAAIGTTFDTLVDPLDRTAFGDPSDIDANGKIIIFYTVEVNKLTEANSIGTVEGFFNPRDLFPNNSTAELQGCTGSNVAEMFYMLVPDPLGTINGNAHSKDEVQRSTISVTAHEYQHLINSARRIYVNNADDFEEVWLNEGLSHVAEELLFYRTSGLTPRSNIDLATIRASERRRNAFNEHQIFNFGRYELFLEDPEISSPYADNDSLSNRGAIWSFLRYAADRKAASDGQIWFSLVNSQTSGFDNLKNVFTTDIMTWFRDWSMSVYSDDKTSAASTFQQPSWNFRDIFPALDMPIYPLSMLALTNAQPLNQTLKGGSSMYASFGVGAGVTAGLSLAMGSSAGTFSIVRVR